jgi:hypothetical protein
MVPTDGSPVPFNTKLLTPKIDVPDQVMPVIEPA